MTRRRARKLYEQALERYRKGYIDGTQAASYDRNHGKAAFRLGGSWERDDPAFHAGHEAGYSGDQANTDHLPLDVWVRVLAKAQLPASNGRYYG